MTVPEPGSQPSPDEVPADPEPPSGPRRLDPRVRRYWWTRSAIRTLLVGVVVLAMDLEIFLPRLVPDAWPRGLFGGLVTLGVLVWGVVVPPVAYERWRFALRADDLWIRRGILIRTVSVIPYRRLQFVDTEQGPLARLFGLAELVVHTAAPGTSGRVPGLDAQEAEVIRERLAHLEPDHDEPI